MCLLSSEAGCPKFNVVYSDRLTRELLEEQGVSLSEAKDQLAVALPQGSTLLSYGIDNDLEWLNLEAKRDRGVSLAHVHITGVSLLLIAYHTAIQSRLTIRDAQRGHGNLTDGLQLIFNIK